MPTYDYECERGHRFEIFQSMKDKPLSACSECGAPVKRLIGPGAGFLFRGDGFYITDYRSKTYKEKAKAEGSAAAPKSDAGTAPKKDGGTTKSDSGSSASPSKKAGADKPKKDPGKGSSA